MPNVKHRMLTDETVEAATKEGTYNDGEGLTVRVSKSGRKHWVQRVTIDGKPRNIGLGSYPAVGLSEARERAQENRTAIRQGRDLIQERREAMEQATMPTFREVSKEFIEIHRPTWRTPDSAKQWESSLSNHVFPVLGDKPVNEITVSDVKDVLASIWLEKEETARRVLQRMERIFDHAIMEGWRQDNPAGKHIKYLLPKQGNRREGYTVLPYQEVPSAVAAVRDSSTDQNTKLAFEFMVLCAARSREVRHAVWDEVDLDNGVWTIPASRMKTEMEHRVRLSDRAVEILTEARDRTNGEGLVFPSTRSVRAGEPKPLSDTVFGVLCNRLEVPGIPHGFRSSFKTWTMEEQGQPRDIADGLLGLSPGIDIESRMAFKNPGFVEVERRLIQNWGHFVTTGESLPFE
jgi:integrase